MRILLIALLTLCSGICTGQHKVGIGVSSNKELVISNPTHKAIKLEARATYRHLEENTDIWNIFYVSLTGEIRWKRTSKYSLSSGFNIPVEGLYLQFDNLGYGTKQDLEVNFYWEWVPISCEVFIFRQFQNTSVFISTKFRYFYLNTLEPLAGIKLYF